MIKIGRIVIGLLLVFIISFIIIAFLSLRLVRNSLPQINGSIKIQGLRSRVEIYRDDYGIPHIFANNEDDLFFAMGFVTAQDRLWQMDLSRRTAEGTLSEIFGEKMLTTDRLFRTIGIDKIAHQIAEQLSPESKIMLARYTAGINHLITENKLPIEFTVLNYKPRLWKIEDSIAYQRLVAWGLSVGRYYDLLFGALVEKLGYARVNEIFPDYLPSDPVIITSSTIKFSSLLHQFYQTSKIIDWIPDYPASDSWVISGEKSTTGKPLLANDPHLKLTLPSLFYEIHLVAPFIDCYGVAMPGMLGIIIGHNQAIAWGLTNMMVDDTDFFIEKVDFNHYFYKNEWHPIDLRTEVIPVRGQKPDTFLIRSTVHGPIVSDVLNEFKNSDQVISMRWTGFDFSDEILTTYRLLKAKNWEQFLEGLESFKVPGQNVIYADTSGNIGYWGAAAIPIRKSGKGEIPYPGVKGAYDWRGYIPFKRLPYLFNPQQKLIVTANNKVFDFDNSYYISNYWEPSHRASRIIELLSQKDKFTIDDFQQIQNDIFSNHARAIIPYILQALSNIQPTDDLQYYFIDALKNWDFQMSSQAVAPSIFNIFMTRFIENIFHDEMGDTLYHQFIELPGLAIKAMDHLLTKRNSIWFDDINTGQIENMDDMILKSLDDAFNILIQKHGKLIDDWRWGKLHQVKFNHPLIEQKPLNIIFDMEAFPLGGDNSTISLGGYFFKDPFTVNLVPITRQIVDLSNMNNSRSVIATGQSGQPLDEHFKDQLDLWHNGKYHQAIMDADEIRNSDFDLLVLKPR